MLYSSEGMRSERVETHGRYDVMVSSLKQVEVEN